jgi:hypothetical protein
MTRRFSNCGDIYVCVYRPMLVTAKTLSCGPQVDNRRTKEQCPVAVLPRNTERVSLISTFSSCLNKMLISADGKQQQAKCLKASHCPQGTQVTGGS